MAGQASKRIQQGDLIRLTQLMVRIPSVNPPGNEEDLAEFLVQKLKSYGFSSKLVSVKPKRSNVLALLSGKKKGKTILMNGHMDVVPVGDLSQWKFEPFSGTLHQGRIYGRGSVDMKGGLASAIIAAKAFADTYGEDFAGSILIAGVVDEEDAGIGSKKLVESVKADMAIVAEASDNTIYRAHKGTLWFEVTTKGKALHSSRVRSGNFENAIYRMSRVVNTLEDYLTELEKRKDGLVGNPTINVSVIKGGTKTNVVPESCTITVDRRLLPKENPKIALEEIRKLLASKTRLKNLEYRVALEREGAIIKESEPIVKLTRNAVQEVTGKQPKITGCMATTDMAFLVNQGKIPTVVYGPGSLEQAHVANEYVEVEELLKAAKVYTTIFEAVLCK